MAILETFLTSISEFLRQKDSNKLKQWLWVEPPAPDHYTQLGLELKAAWQDGKKLEKLIDKLVKESEDETSDEGGTWPGFNAFLKEYLIYWRDADWNDMLGTNQRLSDVVAACITALSHSKYGIIMLPTTEQLCGALARLAMMLDKRPDLLRRVRIQGDEGETRKTLVETTAESIQRAFTVCLTERTANRNGIGRDGMPEGKKIGIYAFANMVLRLLFQCRKSRLSNQLFTNITQNSPPLGLYPAPQRVTFLYYLGRYHFSHNHFWYAQACLQSAYGQCHPQFLSQRRSILIYLFSTNLILGRFPTEAFLSRREAADLLPKFMPVVNAIKKGNMLAFKAALGPSSGNERWFFKHGILLPLLSRCEVLVWRSLARRVFLLTYQPPTTIIDPTKPFTAPVLYIEDVVVAAQLGQKQLEGWTRPISAMTARQHPNAMFLKTPDLEPPVKGRTKLGPYGGMIFGNQMPELHDVEAILASLVSQGLMYGVITHSTRKFSILGSKNRGGPLKAGFPVVWQVLQAKAKNEERGGDVPGWVQNERATGMGGVVNLSGIARPVGSGG